MRQSFTKQIFGRLFTLHENGLQLSVLNNVNVIANMRAENISSFRPKFRILNGDLDLHRSPYYNLVSDLSVVGQITLWSKPELLYFILH